jgi:hypothetical protein
MWLLLEDVEGGVRTADYYRTKENALESKLRKN